MVVTDLEYVNLKSAYKMQLHLKVKDNFCVRGWLNFNTSLNVKNDIDLMFTTETWYFENYSASRFWGFATNLFTGIVQVIRCKVQDISYTVLKIAHKF